MKNCFPSLLLLIVNIVSCDSTLNIIKSLLKECVLLSGLWDIPYSHVTIPCSSLSLEN